MIKRLMLLVAALTALLVAVPAFANASTGLTSSKGLLLPVGTQMAVNGTGTEGLFSYTLSGQLNCEPAFFTAVVARNSPTVGVEANGREGWGGGCTRGGSFLKWSQIELLGLTSSFKEAGKGTANIGFTVEVFAGSFCRWSSKEALFTYTPEGDTITFAKVSLAGSPGGCGTAQWSASFTLQSKEGASLLLM